MRANPGHTIQHGGHLLLDMEQQICRNCCRAPLAMLASACSDLSTWEYREQGWKAD
jgi:hypothetical protein